MISVITIIHIIVCVFLVLVVLMQGTKSEGLAGFFGGGGSATLFGTGTRTFLAKVATALGVAFMLTSILLAVLQSRGSSSVMEQSVMQEDAVPAETESPLPEM